MKIIIISPFFSPEPISTGRYNTFLSKELASRRHDIEIVCFHPIYPTWKVEPTNQQLRGVKAHRGGRYLVLPKNQYLRRIILEIVFSVHAFFSMILLPKMDLVINVMPPSLFLLVTLPIQCLRARKVAAIVHDLQGVYAERSGGHFRNFVSKIIQWIEKTGLKHMDQVVFLSQEMKSYCVKNYDLYEKSCVVHYPFATLTDQLTGCQGMLREVLEFGKTNIVYSGALGEKHNPEDLYLLMKRICEMDDTVRCHFFSAGPVFESLKAQNDCEKIMFHPLVPEQDLASLYALSDIQIVPQAPGTSKGSMPSKLPNLVASRCKVLVISDPGSELSSICLNIPSIHCETHWDIPILANKILEIARKDVVDRESSEFGMFSIESLVTDLTSIIPVNFHQKTIQNTKLNDTFRKSV